MTKQETRSHVNFNSQAVISAQRLFVQLKISEPATTSVDRVILL